MNVLLVNLDHGSKTRSTHVPVALGLLKLGAYYRQEKHTVKMASCQYLNKTFTPDIICFSPLFFFNLKADLGFILSYRKMFPKALIRIGGMTVTFKRDVYTKHLGTKNVELVEGLQPEFDGVLPAYDLLGMTVSYGFTSRGCTRKCEWCVVPKTEGKMQKVGHWKNSIHPDHKLYLAMDNNFLACGYDWVEDVITEFVNRKMKVDFNQGLDCRIFASDGRFVELFHRHKEVFYALRFSWDSKAQDKYVVKTLEMLKKTKVKGSSNTLWYMLYGAHDNPEEIWNRIRVLTSYGNRIKPMCFRNLETGGYESGWVEKFRQYIYGVSGSTNYISENNFRDGVYGHTPDGFLKVLEIGKKTKNMSRNFLKNGLPSLINEGENARA